MSNIDLDTLEQMLSVPGQDMNGFVPALIERVRKAEAERDDYKNKLLYTNGIFHSQQTHIEKLELVREAARSSLYFLEKWIEHANHWHYEVRPPFVRCYCSQGELAAALAFLENK